MTVHHLPKMTIICFQEPSCRNGSLEHKASQYLIKTFSPHLNCVYFMSTSPFSSKCCGNVFKLFGGCLKWVAIFTFWTACGMNCDERPNQEKSELHLEALRPKLVKYARRLFGRFFYCVLNPQSNSWLPKNAISQAKLLCRSVSSYSSHFSWGSINLKTGEGSRMETTNASMRTQSRKQEVKWNMKNGGSAGEGVCLIS